MLLWTDEEKRKIVDETVLWCHYGNLWYNYRLSVGNIFYWRCLSCEESYKVQNWLARRLYLKSKAIFIRVHFANGWGFTTYMKKYCYPYSLTHNKELGLVSMRLIYLINLIINTKQSKWAKKPTKISTRISERITYTSDHRNIAEYNFQLTGIIAEVDLICVSISRFLIICKQ